MVSPHAVQIGQPLVGDVGARCWVPEHADRVAFAWGQPLVLDLGGFPDISAIVRSVQRWDAQPIMHCGHSAWQLTNGRLAALAHHELEPSCRPASYWLDVLEKGGYTHGDVSMAHGGGADHVLLPGQSLLP